MRRLLYHHKEIKSQCKGRNRDQRLSELWAVPVYEGDLVNEQVKKEPVDVRLTVVVVVVVVVVVFCCCC